MNIKKIGHLNTITGLIIISLLFGFLLEDPFDKRFWLLMTVSIIYIGTIVIRNKLKNNKIIFLIEFILIGILVFLEMNSKFVMNYFYQILYFVEMIYCISYMSRKVGIMLSGLSAVAAMIKFGLLINVDAAMVNLTLAGFMLLINSLILGIVILAKSYWNEEKRTKELYKELLIAHKQLKIYSEDVKSLGAYEERNKIARDLHDTLGHEMTGLIMQMEIASSAINDSRVEEGYQILNESKVTARGALKKVREIVNALKDDDNQWTREALLEMINDFSKKTKMIIHSNIQDFEQLSPDVSAVIYRVIQEAMTNSVKHSHATEININLCRDKNITLEIEDNGEGCEKVVKGNGLKGMEERVALIGGNIIFDYDKHFKVSVTI